MVPSIAGLSYEHETGFVPNGFRELFPRVNKLRLRILRYPRIGPSDSSHDDSKRALAYRVFERPACNIGDDILGL